MKWPRETDNDYANERTDIRMYDLAMTTSRQYQDNDNDTLFISSKYHDVTVNHSIFIMNSAYNSEPLK